MKSMLPRKSKNLPNIVAMLRTFFQPISAKEGRVHLGLRASKPGFRASRPCFRASQPGFRSSQPGLRSRQLDGWMDGLTDGRMDGQTD